MTNHPQNSSAIVKLYDDLILEGQLKFEYVCGILSDSDIKQLISHYSVAIRRPNGDKESLESFTKVLKGSLYLFLNKFLLAIREGTLRVLSGNR